MGVVLDSNNDAHFYLNGLLVETVDGIAGGTDAPSTDFTFGNQSPGFGHTDEIYFGGIAGVSVYDTALTAEQIQDQYVAAIVPEPSSIILIGLGAFISGCTLRQRRRIACD